MDVFLPQRRLPLRLDYGVNERLLGNRLHGDWRTPDCRLRGNCDEETPRGAEVDDQLRPRFYAKLLSHNIWQTQATALCDRRNDADRFLILISLQLRFRMRTPGSHVVGIPPRTHLGFASRFSR